MCFINLYIYPLENILLLNFNIDNPKKPTYEANSQSLKH